MLKRRDFLKVCAGAALAGPAPELDGAELRPQSRCLPVISGTLWWCSPEQSRSWGAAGWIKELQEQQELGFDLLWLVQGPRLIGNEFSLRQLLDVCAQRQIQVIVDTGSTSNWYAPLDLKKELELCREFWGNVEVAEMECPSIEEYVRRYGRVHHSAAKGIPWRPVSMDRLRNKLALAAEYAERIVSWGYQEFCRPGLGPTASKWYESYRAYRWQVAPKKGVSTG